MVMWLILYLNTSYVTVKLPSKSSNVSSSSNLNTSYVTVKRKCKEKINLIRFYLNTSYVTVKRMNLMIIV
mgnify:CR=1 FL=1